MAAIPTILRGDDSGAISITMATGRTYTGMTLVVAYQGVTRSFANLTPGGTVSLSFTHEETANFALKTAPMLMRLVNQQGVEETVDNAEARIKVTDCVSEVNAGGAVIVTPGGAVPITDVGDVAARYTLADLQAKVNQIVHVLAQRSLLGLLLSACCLASFGDVSVQTARLDALYNDSLVVTNVTGGGGGGGSFDAAHLNRTNMSAYADDIAKTNGSIVGRVYRLEQGGGGGSVSTNDILALVNDQFVGGTNAVNAVIANTNAWNAKIDAQQATNLVDYLVAVTNVSRGLAPNIDIAIMTAGYAFDGVTYAADPDAPTETWCYLDYSTNGMALQSRGIFLGNTNRAFCVVSNTVENDTGAYPITVRIVRAALYETRNRYGLATMNALTSVSNAAVSAYALATNAQPRLTSANAGANISIAPKAAYKWDVTSGEVLSKYRVLYTHDFKDRLGECYTAYTDEALTAKAEMEDPELPGYQQYLGVYDSGDIQIGYDLYSVGNSTRDSSFAPSFIIISAPTAQTTNNIVTEISASSDDAHYPSAKAAYDCATNAASVATSDMETQTHAAETYQVKGDYATKAEAGESATNVVAGVTNNFAVAIGRSAVAVHKRLSSDYPVAIGYNAKATNSYSSAFGYNAKSHGKYSVNFQQLKNDTTSVGSLSQIYFGDFTLREMVADDTQLWQDCASPVASNVVANAVTTYAPTNAIVALNQSVQSVNVPSGSSLTIQVPTDAVKDWIVYAHCSSDDTPLILPSGNYYAADEAYTNTLKAGVTALYFTSCSNGVVIGRQELKPITVE